VALPHLRDTNLGDKQEKTPTHKEAQRRALHLYRTLRDALVALAPAVVPEDHIEFLLSQILHILNNGRYLVWLISSTTQLKEGNHDITDDAKHHLY
jgi:hypothetical protein